MKRTFLFKATKVEATASGHSYRFGIKKRVTAVTDIGSMEVLELGNWVTETG